MYFYILLCFLVAACQIVIGSVTYNWARSYERVAFDTQLGVVGAALVFAGAVLALTAILGAVAYRTHSRLLVVMTYSLLLLILFCELGSILLSALHWSNVGLYVCTTLKSELDDYGFDEAVIANVDNVQTSLHCCGINNFIDWNTTAYFKKNGSYPLSCYRNALDYNLNTRNHAAKPVLYSAGCASALVDVIHSKSAVVISVGLTSILFQVIGLHNSCIPSCNTLLRSSGGTTYAAL
ncbi:hypothetical protein EG68_05190 [Paragonimus skrjabini miyazakii]|uniref:Tetraspanin n=1 Tax=Paragonimus skrjabini miyazakii TaxID=59628 RepID=A0A8S9Z313_9TREM|nr:hypothetical protein EG68_05190 [Paragonimus skrjabini miyazakii]